MCFTPRSALHGQLTTPMGGRGAPPQLSTNLPCGLLMAQNGSKILHSWRFPTKGRWVEYFRPRRELALRCRLVPRLAMSAPSQLEGDLTQPTAAEFDRKSSFPSYFRSCGGRGKKNNQPWIRTTGPGGHPCIAVPHSPRGCCGNAP